MPACSSGAPHHFLWCAFKRAQGIITLRGGSLLLLKQLLIHLPLCPLSNSAIKLKERCDTNLQETVSVLYNILVNRMQSFTFVGLWTAQSPSWFRGGGMRFFFFLKHTKWKCLLLDLWLEMTFHWCFVFLLIKIMYLKMRLEGRHWNGFTTPHCNF